MRDYTGRNGDLVTVFAIVVIEVIANFMVPRQGVWILFDIVRVKVSKFS